MPYVDLDVQNYWNMLWLDKYLEGHKGFIAGGCFKNIINGEKVKDLDIFFRSESDWNDAVYYFDSKTAGFGFDGEEVDEEDAEYIFHYENKKVKAYKNKKTGIRIELCRSVFGEPEEILNNFDFSIVKFAYYKEEVEDEPEDVDSDNTHIETKIICSDKFFEHLHLKRLVVDDECKYPMSTFERMFRYARYGYFPCKETKLKVAKALNELSSQVIEVSESLYDGVD